MQPADNPAFGKKPSWDSYVATYAAEFGIPYSLVRGLIFVESTDNPGARNPSGAKGLCQVMPMWFKRSEDPYDPATNIRVACQILSNSYARTGSWSKALSAYNGGLSMFGYINNPAYVLKVFETQQRFA